MGRRRKVRRGVEKVACTGSVGVRKFEAVVKAAKMAANDNGDIV
jgi:hypothetical protein